MSLVLALKASPSSATCLPTSEPRCFWSLPTTRRFWSSLTSITAVRSWKWYPELPASCLSAETSLGKHDPPKPMPGLRKCGPIRWSRPIPRATSSTSAPVSSHTLAISLMNEIFVARNALAASLTISALAMSVRTTGVFSGA